MIITIDGLDGSGKETLTKLLAAKLDAEVTSFPYYDSSTGNEIKKLLSGKIKVSGPVGAGMLFANNRKEYFKTHKFDKNKINIFDRYFISNIIYQGISYDEKTLKYFIEYFTGLEYEDNNIPRPDFQFFLNIPYDVLRKRLDKRTVNKNGEKKDIFEEDSYLKKTYEKSLKIINSKKLLKTLDLIVIDGEENGNILTPEELADKIISIINMK